MQMFEKPLSVFCARKHGSCIIKNIYNRIIVKKKKLGTIYRNKKRKTGTVQFLYKGCTLAGLASVVVGLIFFRMLIKK